RRAVKRGHCMTRTIPPFSVRRAVNPILSERPLYEEEDSVAAFLLPEARRIERYLPLASALIAGAFLLTGYLFAKLGGPEALTHLCVLIAFLLAGIPGLRSAWASLLERRMDIDVL